MSAIAIYLRMSALRAATGECADTHCTRRTNTFAAARVTVFCGLLPNHFGHLLFTHADRQGANISFTVCFVCLFVLYVFVRLRISPPRIKLAASNFARWFIGVLGRESLILGEHCCPEAQNRTNRAAPGSKV